VAVFGDEVVTSPSFLYTLEKMVIVSFISSIPTEHKPLSVILIKPLSVCGLLLLQNLVCGMTPEKIPLHEKNLAPFVLDSQSV
jgi:hypothetical protein